MCQNVIKDPASEVSNADPRFAPRDTYQFIAVPLVGLVGEDDDDEDCDIAVMTLSNLYASVVELIVGWFDCWMV